MRADWQGPCPHRCAGGREGGARAGGAPRRVRKLEDDYFEDWAAGTELDREGFRRIMRLELRRREREEGGGEGEGGRGGVRGREKEIALEGEEEGERERESE